MPDNENVLYFKDSTVFSNLSQVESKDDIIRVLRQAMMVRTQEMFEWKGLPTTIPQQVLEAQLQTKGHAIIFKHNDHIFSCWGNIGGFPNYNYMPSLAVVSNPYIDKSKSSFNLKIYYGKDDYKSIVYPDRQYDGDCVVIPNDAYYIGLVPIHNMYSSEIAETKITKQVLLNNSRAMYIFAASNDDEKDDFDDLMAKLKDGKTSCIVADDLLTEPKTLQFAENALRDFTALIENEQYSKAAWFNDIGLQANYNMKREAINSNESQLNKDAILPLADNMLSMRKKYCDLVNELFGTSWSVDFSSAWKQSRIAIEEALEATDPNSKMDEKEPTQIGNENLDNSEEKLPTQIDDGGEENG